MMLMVSVQNYEEGLEAHKGGADIIDIKNLQEALVGSAHPWLAKELRAVIPPEKHVSITLGVVPNQEGTVAMAAYAAGRLNATSVKVGFLNTEYGAAVSTLRASKKALEGTQTKLIGSTFADSRLYKGLEADCMVELAKEGGCDGWLIDTLTKDGRNLFDFVPEERLHEMVFRGKELGMSTALSGHLKLSNLDELARINPDIVGVRGAVCSKGERAGTVSWEAVAELKRQIELRKSGEILVHGGNGNGHANGWVVIDGTSQNCAGIIAALTAQVEKDAKSLIEVIIPDALNIYDVILWSEKRGHRLLNQRKEGKSVRVLVQP
ncbi:MAG: hypothetical protein HYY17_01510 [Planctomycetes bacterium]|nr:hypothetical protein [Planctomycetota bacterium]